MATSGFDNAPDLSFAAKLLRLNWLLAALLVAAASLGFLMLYSVAGGSIDPWARPQIVRFAFGFVLMLLVALIDIRIWRRLAFPLYFIALALLVAVEFYGVTGMGAQRWLRVGPLQLQPSEVMKVALVMALAAFYHQIGGAEATRLRNLPVPLVMVAAPATFIALQPDLGTAIMLLAIGGAVMFLAGVALWLFVTLAIAGGAAIWAVFVSHGTSWQILKDYQFRRIETFIDPSSDPLGAGYHIIQSTIAIGSGGLDGKGFLRGSQTQLSFLPETHTDFIFTTLAEELGFRGGVGLIVLYVAILLVAFVAAARCASTFGRLLAGGVAATFFFLFAINIAMVTGLAPVVGVPLPLVSFGGTSLLVLLFSFGLVMSAEIHRDDPLLR